MGGIRNESRVLHAHHKTKVAQSTELFSLLKRMKENGGVKLELQNRWWYFAGYVPKLSCEIAQFRYFDYPSYLLEFIFNYKY